MRIKKHENGNEYLYTKSGIWVRNFTTKVSPININSLTSQEEYKILVENEIQNNMLNIAEIDTSLKTYEKAVIISDGFNFVKNQELLLDLPNDTIILATNRSVAKWKTRKAIHYFIVNNPYPECMLQMPEKYFPRLIASSKTYPRFIKDYDEKGEVIYRYSPSQEVRFSPANLRSICVIDDYRNPICAAIGFAYRWGVKKLALFCCDDVFEGERAGAVKLPNGYWMYPQHFISHDIINASLFWYKKTNAKIVNCSNGPEYDQAPYINTKELMDFFYEV